MVRIVTMPVIWAILLVLAPAFATPLGDNSDQPLPSENETTSDPATTTTTTEAKTTATTEKLPDPITIKPPGSTEELRPNLVGLANMAIVHLPRSLTFHHVIKATREIIDGVRYELLVNTQNIEKNNVTCSLVIVEKPWITTESGDKLRILRSTNCTVDENDKFDPNLYEGNTIFNSSNTKVTQGELSDLEEQILAAARKKKPSAEGESSTDGSNKPAVSQGVIKGIETQIVTKNDEPVMNLSDGSLTLLDTIFSMDNTDSTRNASTKPVESPETDVANLQPGEAENRDPQIINESPPASNASQPSNKDISDDAKAILDSIFMPRGDGVDTSTTEKQEAVEPEHVVIHVTPPSNDDCIQNKPICDKTIQVSEASNAKTENLGQPVADGSLSSNPSAASDPIKDISDDSKALLESMFLSSGGITKGQGLPIPQSVPNQEQTIPQVVPIGNTETENSEKSPQTQAILVNQGYLPSMNSNGEKPPPSDNTQQKDISVDSKALLETMFLASAGITREQAASLIVPEPFLVFLPVTLNVAPSNNIRQYEVAAANFDASAASPCNSAQNQAQFESQNEPQIVVVG